MNTCKKQKEDSTNERMIEDEMKVKEVVSDLTTNESSLEEEGWQGLRERRTGKDNEDKEDAVDVVDGPEKGQLKLEQTNFVPEKKTSQGVRLLTYFEAPPHLRFNQYVHGSYRPPMDVHGCLARY